jgi:hypothetical protein
MRGRRRGKKYQSGQLELAACSCVLMYVITLSQRSCTMIVLISQAVPCYFKALKTALVGLNVFMQSHHISSVFKSTLRSIILRDHCSLQIFHTKIIPGERLPVVRDAMGALMSISQSLTGGGYRGFDMLRTGCNTWELGMVQRNHCIAVMRSLLELHGAIRSNIFQSPPPVNIPSIPLVCHAC